MVSEKSSSLVCGAFASAAVVFAAAVTVAVVAVAAVLLVADTLSALLAGVTVVLSLACLLLRNLLRNSNAAKPIPPIRIQGKLEPPEDSEAGEAALAS